MKRSISFSPVDLDCGTGTEAGSGVKDQCGSYSAPCSIQRVRISRSDCVSWRGESGGGITSSGSVS